MSPRPAPAPDEGPGRRRRPAGRLGLSSLSVTVVAHLESPEIEDPQAQAGLGSPTVTYDIVPGIYRSYDHLVHTTGIYRVYTWYMKKRNIPGISSQVLLASSIFQVQSYTFFKKKEDT